MPTCEDDARQQCSDEELIRRIQQGNGERATSGEELVRRYSNRLRQRLHDEGFSAEDADEIVQETFLAVFSRVDTLDVEKTTVSHWFSVLVANRILKFRIEAILASRLVPLNMETVELEDLRTVQAHEASDETQAALTRLLNELAPLQREVMTLYLAGVAPIEIAAQLGKTPTHIYHLRSNAIRKLRWQISKLHPRSSTLLYPAFPPLTERDGLSPRDWAAALGLTS